MKKICSILIFLGTANLYGQITVDDSSFTVEQLVADILVNSGCAETSDYVSFTGTDFGINGIGYFNAESTSFPYDEGIILSTGRALDARGPNDIIKDSGEQDWSGDEDLRRIADLENVFNASFIQFDFVPLTNNISFNFLFASEEYSEDYQCVFSDAFAFILTDSNDISTNLAIIPGSNQPVRVTTIRPGITDRCDPANPGFFDRVNGSTSAISFHGQTKSLKAESVVIPGEKYTIKLVIADNGDSQFDSAVFLEAGSFNVGYDLGEDRTIVAGNPVCLGESLTLDASDLAGVLDYIWYKDNVEVPEWRGDTTVDAIESGTYRVELVFSPQCISEGEITIEFIAPPEIEQQPIPLIACDVDKDGSETFDFTDNGLRIIGNQNPDIYQVKYYNSQTDAESSVNPISMTNAYISTTPSDTIYARISSGDSCFEVVAFNVIVQSIDFTSSLQEEYALCLDAEGNIIYPLPVLDTGLSSSDYNFTWYYESVAAENILEGATAPFYEASEEGIYHVVLQNLGFRCEFSFSTNVIISQQPNAFEVEIISDLFTDNNIIEIMVEGNSEYLFSVDDQVFGATNRFEKLAGGNHVAYVTDTFNCSVLSMDFLVVDYPRFFTPNGDSINDKWNIAGLAELEDVMISIYDRYGQLQYQFFGDRGWDGTSNNKRVPESDYWFKIEYTKDSQPKEFKSHFSLKR